METQNTQSRLLKPSVGDQKKKSSFKKNPDRYLLVTVIVSLILLIIGIMGMMLFGDDELGIFDPADIIIVKETSQNTVLANIPEYDKEFSKPVFESVSEAAMEWADDYRIISGSATILPYISTESNIRYFLGFDMGAYTKWNFIVYSPSRDEDVSLRWEEGRTTFGTPYQASKNADKRDYYNDLDSIISSEKVYKIVKDNGFNEETNYIDIHFGYPAARQIYGSNYIWEVQEKSKTLKEDFDNTYITGKVIRTYFIDGQKGDLLQVETKDA